MLNQKISSKVSLIAACGLYCGSCRKYIKGSCPGCKENIKATWCKIRSCNLEHHTANCTECTITNSEECKSLNNTIGKIFKFVFKTDRLASLQYIANYGEQSYVDKMTALKQMAIKKGQKIER